MLRQTILKLHRGEGRFYGGLKRTIVRTMNFSLTPPAFLRAPLYAAYSTHFVLKNTLRGLINICYSGPLFKARCERVGKNLHLWFLPHVSGPTQLFLGDDVKVFGLLHIISSRVIDNPRLEIGNGVHLGHKVSIIVNREVVIEEGCNIASGVRIADSDAHPRNSLDRIKGLPPPPDEIKPVRICRGAWLSTNCMVMKGVTVGEGAVVGAGSIVMTDVPPYAVVMGNPARIIVKDVRTVHGGKTELFAAAGADTRQT
jgi:acetyltransferase-like isoleucine patch superfamily enzyme